MRGDQKGCINTRKTYTLKTNSCLKEKPTRRRQTYVHRTARRGKETKNDKAKQQQEREREKRENRVPGGDSNMDTRLCKSIREPTDIHTLCRFLSSMQQRCQGPQYCCCRAPNNSTRNKQKLLEFKGYCVGPVSFSVLVFDALFQRAFLTSTLLSVTG